MHLELASEHLIQPLISQVFFLLLLVRSKIGSPMSSSLAGTTNISLSLLPSFNKAFPFFGCVHAATFLRYRKKGAASEPFNVDCRLQILAFPKVSRSPSEFCPWPNGTRSFFSTPKPRAKEGSGGKSRSDSDYHTRELEAIF